MGEMVKDTSFGEIGKRDIYILIGYLQDRVEKIEGLIRKVRRIFQNWQEAGIEDLEDALWDICIVFNDCYTCPAEFFCKKKKYGGEENGRKNNHRIIV